MWNTRKDSLGTLQNAYRATSNAERKTEKPQEFPFCQHSVRVYSCGFLFSLVPLQVFPEVFVEPWTRLGVALEHPAVGMGLKPGDERHACPRKAVRERLVVLRGHYAVRPDRLRNIWG